MAPETACVLIGQPGIGKTQFAISLAKELCLKLVKLRCAEDGETGDLTGLLRDVNGVHSHTIPDWLSGTEPMLLLLDEINRPKKEIINAIMQLCTEEQEFLGKKLPAGSRVICTMNSAAYASNDVDELNRAFFSRLARFYVDVDKSGWLSWATTHRIHPDIISYIDQADDSHLFDMTDVESYEDDHTVNPRSWEAFSKMYINGVNMGSYKDDPIVIKKDAEIWLGSEEANSFYSWLCTKRLFNPQNFLLENNQAKVTASAARVAKMLTVYQTALCGNIMQTAISLLSDPNMTEYNKNIVSNLYHFVDRMPVEQASKMYVDYIEPCIKITDKPDWLIKLMHTNESVWSSMKTVIQGKRKK